MTQPADYLITHAHLYTMQGAGMGHTGLCIYLLGPLRIAQDGVPLRLPRRKVESLLAYLILHPEQHGRDQLATLFWGESSDAQAHHSLRTALATLRKEMGPALLETDRDHVQLNPAFPLWVDLHYHFHCSG